MNPLFQILVSRNIDASTLFNNRILLGREDKPFSFEGIKTLLVNPVATLSQVNADRITQHYELSIEETQSLQAMVPSLEKKSSKSVKVTLPKRSVLSQVGPARKYEENRKKRLLKNCSNARACIAELRQFAAALRGILDGEVYSVDTLCEIVKNRILAAKEQEKLLQELWIIQLVSAGDPEMPVKFFSLKTDEFKKKTVLVTKQDALTLQKLIRRNPAPYQRHCTSWLVRSKYLDYSEEHMSAWAPVSFPDFAYAESRMAAPIEQKVPDMFMYFDIDTALDVFEKKLQPQPLVSS